MNYLLLLMMSWVISSHSMNTPEQQSKVAILEDNKNEQAIVTDPKTLGELMQLSGALKDKQLIEQENKYILKTGLSKAQLTFLIQLNVHKSDLQNKLTTQDISLADLTRSDINELGLPPKIKTAFDKLLILQTSDGVRPVEKDIVTYFFGFIKDAVKEFPDSFIITLPPLATQTSTLILYNLVKKIEKGKDPLSLKEWKALKDSIKQKISVAKQKGFLILLQLADALQAKSFLMMALFESYKATFSAVEWEKEIEENPWLKNIAGITLAEYPSIEEFLKQNKAVYSIESKNSLVTKKKELTIRISAPIADLTGLALIPQVSNCKILIIENTNITSIPTGIFSKLPDLLELYFINNTKLSSLEPGCLSLFSLRILSLEGSNIQTISAGIFRLASLTGLSFVSNHIHAFEKNWAVNIPNLANLIIQEPELEVLKDGWLNGLKNTDIFFNPTFLNPNTRKQIEKDTAISGNNLTVYFDATITDLSKIP